MRASDIPKVRDNDLITEYVLRYSTLVLNMNGHGGTKQLEAQCKKLEDELLKRGILTEENLSRLRT